MFGKLLDAGLEQGNVAPELVDEEALDERTMAVLHKIIGALEPRKHAAPVNVANDDHTGLSVFCHAHVDNVGGLQVDLCRTACAFDDDPVRLRFQRSKRLLHDAEILLGERVVFLCRTHPDGLAHAHQLRNTRTLWFEQHGVHANVWSHTARLGLQHLRTSDLLAVRRDPGVECHVLRLEGAHPEIPVCQPAAESGGKQAFANSRAGALEHHDTGHFKEAGGSGLHRSCRNRRGHLRSPRPFLWTGNPRVP